jgi:hypothetical protein
LHASPITVYFNKKNKKNREMAKNAVVASIREVLFAFKTGKVGGIPYDAFPFTNAVKKYFYSTKDNELNWNKYLNDEGQTGYSSSSIPFAALKIAPDERISRKLNRRPAMFKAEKAATSRWGRLKKMFNYFSKNKSGKFKILARRNGVENTYDYVPLSRNKCEMELARQGCKVI